MKYREGINLWEDKRFIFWIIPYYHYSIWKQGKVHTTRTIFIKNNKTKKYFEFIPPLPLKVGKREFTEKYKNNKWLVPTNYELDLNIP